MLVPTFISSCYLDSPMGSDALETRRLFWSLRRYRDGDKQAIYELLNIAFGKWHSLNYWEWLYKKNPAGSAVIWVAEHDSKLISHFALIPVKMKVGNTYLTACYAADAVTHPDYQSRGVHVSVRNMAHCDTADAGIPLSLVAPRRKLIEWKRRGNNGHICLMGSITKVLNCSSLLRRRERSNEPLIHASKATQSPEETKSGSVLEGLEIGEIDLFDERIDTFWSEISSNYEIIVKRDQAYLNWRYAEHPEIRYIICLAEKRKRILGYCVLSEIQEGHLKVGRIVDILGFSRAPNVVGQLIQVALTRFKNRGLDLANCFLSEKHPYRTMFWKAGFVPYPLPNVDLRCAVNLPGTYSSAEVTYSQALAFSQNPFLKEKRNWFLMDCDFDWT
jgi:hypothetical protein